MRLCTYVGAACLFGIVCLLGTGGRQENPPLVVGFAETPAHADPVVYKQFAQMQASQAAPFSFHKENLSQRSFVVREESSEEPPEPELDIEDLSIMAILMEGGRRYAVLHDIRASTVIRVGVGDTVREAEIVSIARDHLVLRLSGRDFELSCKNE